MNETDNEEFWLKLIEHVIQKKYQNLKTQCESLLLN